MQATSARSALLLAASVLGLHATAQADWPNWRGPHYNGSNLEEAPLPTSFGPEENVAWSVALPGPGASTPIIVDGKVFLTAIEPEGGDLLAIAFDEATGEVLWEDAAGSGYQPGGKGSKVAIHGRSNYASPSAVSDGQRVVFFFGNGDLVSYSLDGERQWALNLQKEYGDFAFQWTFSASPTLYQDLVLLPILQRNEPANGLGKQGAESFLLGLDAATGKERYRTVRPSDAKMESLESYATLIPHSHEGREELLIVGGDVISGHEPTTGKELWRWGTWNQGHREMWWRVVPSAVVGEGVVLACAPKSQPIFAVKLGGEGVLPPEAVVWQSEGRRNPISSDVPTPLYYQGAFYVLGDKTNTFSKVDPKTGEVAWTRDLPSRTVWRASPTGADGKIYIMNHGGLAMVLDASSGEVLHQVEMAHPDEDGIRSTIAVSGGRLFLRTNDTLFAIARAKQ